MPSNTVKSFAKKTDKSVDKVEELWHKAKDLATEQGITIGKSKKTKAKFYSYVTGILKKMLSITESEVKEQFGHLMTEMLTLGDLNSALYWDDSPIEVKDSHTGERSKLPLMTPRKLMKDKKKKKKNYLSVKSPKKSK